MILSVVATLYNSSAYIEEFTHRVTEVARTFAGDSYEIILVNDGSPDDSLRRSVNLTACNPHLVVVDLSRNFGHHKAMMTGLAWSCGKHVFLIDSDLEEEPEWLPLFKRQMKEDEADVVYGVQQHRRGGWVERLSGSLFYRLFRLLTGIDQPDNIVTARLMTRRYVNALMQHKERELNIGGLWMETGFRQSCQVVKKHATSSTTYTLTRKLRHFVNAMTSFSSLPLEFTFYSGAALSITATIYIFIHLLRHFLVATPLDGYASIVASIWLFSGLIILFLGLQGIYIAKIFSEVKQRPYTIIRQVYRGSDKGIEP